MGEENNNIISTDDIAEYFYNRLLEKGHIPTEEEVKDISSITFDYLISLGVIYED